MTEVYFVRHAEPNYENHNDVLRELTEKGMSDRKLVTEFLIDKKIDVVFSSPYKRSVDTVKHFADTCGLEIETIHDFRERKIDSQWIEDFNGFEKAQWEDFDFKYSEKGESLREVQSRNIAAINHVLERYPDKRIAIGSHGTALGTIIHYYDSSFGYAEWMKIKTFLPWITYLEFEGKCCKRIRHYDVFKKCRITF